MSFFDALSRSFGSGADSEGAQSPTLARAPDTQELDEAEVAAQADSGDSYESVINSVDPNDPQKDEDLPRAVTQGRRQQHAMFYDLSKAVHSWKTFSFVLCGLLALTLGMLLWRVTYSPIEVVVAEQDMTGRYLSARPIDGSQITTSEASRRTGLASFIRDIRRATPDPVVQEEYKNRAFAYATEKVEGYIRNHFRGHPQDDPFRIGKEKQREAQINAVSKIPDSGTPSLYKVEWTEFTRNHHGALLKREAWEAYARMTQRKPQNETDARYNLMGIYITSLDWGKRSGPSGTTAAGAQDDLVFPGQERR